MRREKSLSILSRKFIQMFLEGKVPNHDVCAFAPSLVLALQHTRTVDASR